MKDYPFYTAVGAEQRRRRQRHIGHWIVFVWGLLGFLAFSCGLLRHLESGHHSGRNAPTARPAP